MSEQNDGYRRQSFFESDAVDQLISMVLELAAEHWVLRERVFAIERAAERLGLNLSAAVEAYQFNDGDKAALGAMRRSMIENLMRTVNCAHRHGRPRLES